MSENQPACNCEECVGRHNEAQKLSLLRSMLETMYIKGDFDNCSACKFMLEDDSLDSSKLKLCERCKHLYIEGKHMKGNHACKCWKEEYLAYYRHIIKTYIIGACPFCLSTNVDYEKGQDNHIKFLLGCSEEMYCIITCRDCKKKSREYYSLEFKVSEGI